MKYVFKIILLVSFVSCQIKETDCGNFLYILNLDSSFVINLDKDSINTTKGLVDYIMKERCYSNSKYTGTFEIYYNSIDESSSTNINLNNARIRFLGYVCPNSLLDFSYNDLKISVDSLGKYYLENELVLVDSIGIEVRLHIEKSLAYNEASRIIISTLPNSKILDYSSLIVEILKGYYELIKEQSLPIFNKEFCELSNNELMELKKMFPLNLFISYKGYRKPR